MYQIKKNNIITINRGDYLEFPITLVKGEFPKQEVWELEGQDLVFFAIMEPHQPFEEAIVKKIYSVDDVDSEGYLYIKVLPEDTIGLAPGTYYYSIKTLYTIEDSDIPMIDTIIPKTKFIIVD